MTDLANERDAVVRKISDFNFEPVNAEAWTPDGSKSWDRILPEILSSHLFVLILGGRYGWIPDKGPGAAEKLSVTHMEANAARDAGIPILVFLKRLDEETDRDSDDAKRRAAFRKEIGDWESGYFVTKFDLSRDLAEKVGAALVNVLSESYLRSEVQKRFQSATPAPVEPRESQGFLWIPLDPVLLEHVRRREAILLAGAGISLRAGFPSARALSELLVSKVAEHRDDFSGASLTGSFQDTAENFERAYGRRELVEIIRTALTARRDVEPTRGHRQSVQLFKVVITTNFDNLFELACEQAGISYSVVSDDADLPTDGAETLIVKIDGSLASPESLVLTARDALELRTAKPRLWRSLARLLAGSPLVIVGHSLRDANTKTLLEFRGPATPGYVVAPDLGSFDDRRFMSQGLRPVKADADSFFESLASQIE